MTNELQDTPEVESVDVDEIDVDAVLGDAGAEATEATPAVEDDGVTDAEGAAPAVAPSSAQTEAPAPTPFAFNVFGKAYPIDGTRWNPTDKTLAFENDRAFERARQLMSSGREWEMRGRQELVALKRENETIRNTPHAEIEQARVYLEEWQKLMTMPVEQLAEFLQAARTEWPKMEAKAERAYAERLMEQARAAQAPPEPDVDTIVEEARAAAVELVQDYLQGQSWATPDVQNDLVEYLHDMGQMNQYVGRAQRDMPEIGVRQGQYVADWNTARKLLDRIAAPYRRAHEAQSTAATRVQSAQSVATRNAAALSRAKSPTPTAKSSAPPPSAKPRPQDVVSDAMKVWRDMQR